MTRSIRIVLCLFLPATAAFARNVDLSTVPRREAVQLTIYNSEDLTVVRDRRVITFRKGVNPLQFSWANTLIDPSSVEIRFVEHADKLQLLDTTFPHDKPQQLYWNIQSDHDGAAAVEILYFTSGITWSADYTCVADAAESAARIEGFVRVRNNSGEAYENASVRLVVGTINLVEKIAELAGVRVERLAELAGKDLDRLKSQVRREVFLGLAVTERKSAEQPKEIVKEGLSEYFIYTIEGTETIPSGWNKRLRSLEAPAVPLRIQYRYRPAEYGDRLVRMYLMANDGASKLGTTPLPDGQVSVYRDNGRGGLSFLVRQPITYVPIGDKIELNLGTDPNIVFELVKLRTWREEIWLKLRGVDVFRKVDGGVRIEPNATVAGWDDHALFSQRIRNYTAKPIDLEIRRSFDGDVVFRSQLKAIGHDFRTVQFGGTVAAGGKADWDFELITRQGRNAKQNRVLVEEGEPRR